MAVSFASFLVNSGRTLYEVQQILGHSQSIVTERYSHLSTRTLQNAANCASVIIRDAMQPKAAMQLPVTAVPELPSGGLQGDVVDAVPVALPELLQVAEVRLAA